MSIVSFVTVIGASVGIASASFYIFNNYRNCKKTTENKKKKHNKIVMLAGSK